MNNDLKNIDIEKAVAAVIADDPDAQQIAESLALSLQQAKDGLVSVVEIPAVVRTRQKTGLSQNKFAKALRISPATLKSWEQGKRIDAEEFIAVKSFKAKGKRVSNYQIDSVTEIEPREHEEIEETPIPEVADIENADTNPAPDTDKDVSQSQVLDELTGQWRLFGDDE